MAIKISVIIPSYKPSDYIWECLSSLSQQTFEPNEAEYIIILNGPKEPYYNQIQEYIDQNKNVPFKLLYSYDKGVSSARNYGMKMAQGEYITCIDDDDYVSPDYLQGLYDKASSDTIALAYIQEFEDGSSDYKDCFITKDYNTYYSSVKQSYTRPRRYFYPAVCKLIHRDIINGREYDVSYNNGEDSMFGFLITDRVKYVAFTEKNSVYYYRKRQQSAYRAKLSFKKYASDLSRHQLGFWKIYLSHPTGYNFIFFVKCLVASLYGNTLRYLCNK